MFVEQVAKMLNGFDGSDPAECYDLALKIVVAAQQLQAADRNKLAEMLDRRTTELQRLKRLVGEEA